MYKHLIIGILSFVTTQSLGAVLVTTEILAQSPKPDMSGSSDEANQNRATAEMILDRAIERSEAQDESGRELDFESIVLYTVEKLNGDGEMIKIFLSPEIIKEDKTIIEDLIVAAHNNAKSQLKSKTNEEI